MRTPRNTTSKVKMKRTKSACAYLKNINYTLVGEPSELQELAHDVHKFIGDHKLVKGGKTKRKVTATHESTKPKKILDSRI